MITNPPPPLQLDFPRDHKYSQPLHNTSGEIVSVLSTHPSAVLHTKLQKVHCTVYSDASVLFEFQKKRIKLRLVKNWQNSRRVYILLAYVFNVRKFANITSKKNFLLKTQSQISKSLILIFYRRRRIRGVTQPCFTKVSVISATVTCGRQENRS
jgi:hypothetical protein